MIPIHFADTSTNAVAEISSNHWRFADIATTSTRFADS